MSVKAFELVPAIERVNLMSERAPTQISSMESCGKNLYIGTDDCFVVHYLLEEQINQQTGKMTYNSQKIGHKYLTLKKPVMELKAASALNRLFVLCDSTLFMMNMMDLEPVVGGAKVRGVTSFCVNNQPLNSSPFSVEICLALKRKCLQLYLVTEDRIQLMKDISTPSPPLTMALTGEYLCYGTADIYMITNIQTGHTQELFPFDAESLQPSITSISRGEFLLSAPSALGMFAHANGASQRPPLQWSENLISVAFYHPYVLALNDEFVTVHSVLDQQQKQSLPFQGGRQLGQFDGRLFVSSGRDVYALTPVPIQKQIQNLLSLQRVHEALELARSALKTGAVQSAFYQRIQLQVGFIEFAAQNFSEARQLFQSANLDVRELTSLYPHLLPITSSFTRQAPPLHDMADIVQVTQKDPQKIRAFQEFLISYLEDLLEAKNLRHKEEVHCALLKLYAELEPSKLPSFIKLDRQCYTDDCIEHLTQHSCHHALALLHSVHAENSKAMRIWMSLVDGSISDSTFPGLNFLVDFITRLNNSTIVSENIDWLLAKDERLAVKVLISSQTSQSADKLLVDGLLDHLAQYPLAMLSYLEFLVLEKQLKVEKYHTHLSVLYLDNVLQLIKNPNPNQNELDSARQKLQHLLQTSHLYRIQLLLGKIKQTELYAECAILYAKLEEHDKALRLLVHKVRDYKAAESYCLVNSMDDRALRTRLFHLLLSLYLDTDHERHEALVAPAIDLLNRNRHFFNTAKVLETIPDNWSIGLLSHFLTSSIRHNLHRSRTIHLQRMLARTHHLQLKGDNIKIDSSKISLQDDVLCGVCGRDFSEPSFARYPNGVIAHVSCISSKNICPVTGKVFSSSSSEKPPSQKP